MSHVNIKMTRVNFIKVIIMTGMMGVSPHQRCLGLAPGPPPDLCCLLMMLVMKIGTIWVLGVPPPSEVSWACSRPTSGFALSSDDARDENWYDLGSGCAPPHQRCLGLAPGPSPDVRCLLMMLVM